ncbi:hypothetical protein EJ06DRAFT_578176 [Trichodelitschia bisporula]|uniref:Tetraspanin Tsp3 n=1 Tax=Trichodelitschia bisporula TaxID=703511 RepID=A0A6G1IA13_9PEZI|nr:hypothetical protein EJ06DRAFT_578176 [Trichodelitschia bisporula]
MAWTRKKSIVLLSILWLALATAIGGYLLHTSTHLRLPIPTAVSAFTLILPSISGLALASLSEAAHRLALRLQGGHGTPSPWHPLALLVLVIYSTVLATLGGTYTGDMDCRLEGWWQKMYSAKDGAGIRSIQDALECCGLRNTVDRPWPFPRGKEVGLGTCREMTGRSVGCLEEWAGRERMVGGLVVLVAFMVVFWMAAVVVVGAEDSSWLRRYLRDEEDYMGEETVNGRVRRIEGQYLDNPVTEENPSEAGSAQVGDEDRTPLVVPSQLREPDEQVQW